MATTTWTGMKALAARGVVVLVEMRAGELFTSWSNTSGIIYETTPTQRTTLHNPPTFTRVLVDGTTELTSRGSTADVQANPGSFYWNGTKLYVSFSDSSAPWLHTIVADFTIYLCSGSYAGSSPVVFNSNLYWPLIAGIDTITRQIADIFDPRIITPSTRVQVAAGEMWDNIFRLYRWKNRQISILVGGESLTYSEYQTVFTGYVRDAMWREDVIEFEAVGKSAVFDTAFPPDKVTSATCTTSYTYTYQGSPHYTASLAGTDINASCATENAEIGKPVPWIAGYGVVCYDMPLIAKGSPGGQAHHMWACGKNCFPIGLKYTNSSGTTTYYTWGPAPGSNHQPLWIDQSDGVMVSRAGATTATFLWYANGPEDTTVDTYDGGPVYRLAPDIVKLAVQDCGLSVTWDETLLDESRFLTSLMTLQVYQTEPTTLGEFLYRVCKSTGSVIYEKGNGEMVFRTLSPDYRSYVDIDESYGDFLDWEVYVDHLYTYSAANVGWGALSTLHWNTGGQEAVATQSVPEYATEGASESTLDILDTFLETEAGAVCLASRAARWAAGHPMRMRVTTTFRHLDVDIGDTVRIVKSRKPVESDDYTVFGVVLGVGFSLNDGTVFLDIVERFLSRQAFIGAASSPAYGSATADQKRTLGFLTDDDGLSAASNNAAYKISQEF